MSNSAKKEFLELTGKYLAGTASKDDASAIEAYYKLFSQEPEVMERIKGFDLNGVQENIRQKINKRIAELEGTPIKRPITGIIKTWYRISTAAVLLISLSIGLYLYINRSESYSAMQINIGNDVKPGTNNAVLTLADGKKIMLNDIPDGQVALQSGIVISKTKSGELVYTVSSAIKDEGGDHPNIISTPKGGQYQLRLADGTKVWLNAESSIKFPSSFSGLKERIVELDGEAYFEVATAMTRNGKAKTKENRISFVVKSREQKVEVLGTHFNIQGYANAGDVRTTLLEGSVQVSTSGMQHVTLKPGQQSVLTEKGLQVSDADLEQAVAWKAGLFMFNEESLGSIMLKIARWYNVGLRFDDESLKYKVFSGSFSRFTNISKVLQKIELTRAARFNIKDGVITIYKY
jgi:transmembrane sensor